MNNNKNLISKAKKFYENKNFFEAKSCLLSVLKNNQLEKSFKLSLYILISDICYKINDYENAEKFLLKCINQGKLSSQIYLSLGNIYLKKRDYKNSEKFYIKSIDYKKENEIALINLAILYHNLGKKKEAIKLYKKVLKINETNIGALYNLSKIDDSVINIKVIERLKNLIKKKKISNFNLASSFFLLADVEKKKKNFDKEIELITKGNNFSFKENEFKNNQYNNYWLKGISKKVNKISFIKKTQLIDEVKNIYPIFIIGLPRCGSTLIESIISSGDDKVENLGETNLVNWALLNTYRNFNNQLLQNKKIDINVDKVFEKLNYSIKNLNIGRNDKKIFFSEKSLENFYYIELILNMYPNAKFIHPHRDIIDNIFAIYKQFLPNISWSHSIENILLYIDNYLTTLDYFKTIYFNKILSISLKNFTQNPKKVSKEIYEFCDLKWSDNCLDFYKRNDLFINTASNNQMRTSVKKYDFKKYSPYKEMLNMYFNKYDWLNSKT